MNKELVANKNVCVRKSVFGRTNLFLTSKGTLFREVKCSSSATVRVSSASLFHTHSSSFQNHDECKSVCWHCSYEINGNSIRLPRLYDPYEEVYHVDGWFCGPACGKGYILEHTPFDRGYQINIFVRMLRELYGITQPIVEAPPRLSLTKYGGPFDIETFRSQNNVCSIVNPPFVSYCMLVEERQPNETIGEKQIGMNQTVKGLRRPKSGSVKLTDDALCMPSEQGLYQKYLDEVQDNHNATSTKEDTTKEKAPKKQRVKDRAGGLERFSVQT